MKKNSKPMTTREASDLVKENLLEKFDSLGIEVKKEEESTRAITKLSATFFKKYKKPDSDIGIRDNTSTEPHKTDNQ